MSFLKANLFRTTKNKSNTRIFLDKVYFDTLEKITPIFNRTHEVNWSTKQLDIFIGDWLMSFIDVFYISYCEQAHYLHESKKSAFSPVIPFDYQQHSTWTSYKQEYYSDIIKSIYQDYDELILAKNPNQDTKLGFKSTVKKLVLKLLNFLCLIPRKNKVILYKPYLNSYIKSLIISFLSAFRVTEYFSEETPNHGFPQKRKRKKFRSYISSLPAKSKFERKLLHSLGLFIPTSFIEFFETLESNNFPKCKKYYSSIALYGHEPFKFFLATYNPSLIYHQHGGGYGIFKFTTPESRETRLADLYLTWGWRDDGKYKKLPHKKISLAHRHQGLPNIKNSELKVLLITPHVPEIQYRIGADATCYQREYYQAFLKEELAILNSIFSNVNVRVHPNDTHKKEFSFISSFNNIKIDNSPSMLDSVFESDLVIIDHMNTPILEAISIHTPVITFFDEKTLTMRSSFDQTKKDMLDAKIAFSSLSDMNYFLSNNNLIGWWRLEKTQKTYEDFRQNYCGPTTRNWYRDFLEVLS